MGALDILQEVRLARSKSVLDHLNTEDLEEAIRRLTNRMEPSGCRMNLLGDLRRFSYIKR
jgi:hypothetical protein